MRLRGVASQVVAANGGLGQAKDHGPWPVPASWRDWPPGCATARLWAVSLGQGGSASCTRGRLRLTGRCQPAGRFSLTARRPRRWARLRRAVPGFGGVSVDEPPAPQPVDDDLVAARPAQLAQIGAGAGVVGVRCPSPKRPTNSARGKSAEARRRQRESPRRVELAMRHQAADDAPSLIKTSTKPWPCPATSSCRAASWRQRTAQRRLARWQREGRPRFGGGHGEGNGRRSFRIRCCCWLRHTASARASGGH